MRYTKYTVKKGGERMLYEALDAVCSAVDRVVDALLEMFVAGIVDGIRMAEKW